ncbi:MAG: SUMF1/EgtB/PvdO family nonheme iron enzyme [Anaerolineae bacterium]|nr:SUMF1/EgtB/PvdO family nonheme iron enzyme [Anaerolineae bacterium]
MAEMDVLIGSSLGKYQIVEILGKGGMATVYKATHPAINRTVAIKVLPRAMLHDDTFMQRFQREAEVIARLEHFHILPIYDYGEYEGMPYIVMRFLEGGSLQEHVREGPLSWDRIVGVVAQVADALDYAHSQNVIHRDIKPSNIMLDAQGNAYLTDFGIAKISEGTAQLTGSGIVGTPAYMAPEQSNPGPSTPAMDIYALGVTLFEMIAGQVPFVADTPIAQILMHIQNPVPSLQEYNPDIPVEIDEVLRRAMAKSPEERYQTAGDLARGLEAAVMSAGGWSWSPKTVVHSAQTMQAAVSPRANVPTGEKLHVPELASSKAGHSKLLWSRRVLLWGGLGGIGVGIVVAVVVIVSLLGIGEDSGGAREMAAQTATAARLALTTMPIISSSPVDLTNTVGPTPIVTVPTDSIVTEVLPKPTDIIAPTEFPMTKTLRGVSMTLIPAGVFMMGSDTGYPRERPAHEVYLDAYYIDTTEVTNLYYMACVEEGACEKPLDDNSVSIYRYYGTEPYFNYPVINISWYQARDYCKWRGGHLPTEAQWEKAAGWDEANNEPRQFPWGTLVLDGTYLNYGSEIGDPRAVGTYPKGMSAYGLYDMAGNVVEWVNDWYQDDFYEHSLRENPVGPSEGQFKITRGGSYDDRGAKLTTTFRHALGPATTADTLGFRCAWTTSGDPTGD